MPENRWRPAFTGVVVWCPGCEEAHWFDDRWTWDPETMTADPSYKTQGGPRGSEFTCHSFLRNGVWEFLGDSTHSLAGQSIPAPDLPEWLRDGG